MLLVIYRKPGRILVIALALIILWGVKVFFNQPSSSASLSREELQRSGEIVWEIPTNKKIIALTFDDGPDDKYTPAILDILDDNKVKATFFLVGEQVAKYPNVANRIAKEGHEIANHTYTHPILTKISLRTLSNEINRTEKVIKATTGIKTTYFRPPEGYYTREIVDAVLVKGYKIILWSWTQDSRDWANPGVENIVKLASKDANNGNIIILHDCGGDRTQTVQALPLLIHELTEQGFQYVTISELLRENKSINEHASKEIRK